MIIEKLCYNIMLNKVYRIELVYLIHFEPDFSFFEKKETVTL